MNVHSQVEDLARDEDDFFADSPDVINHDHEELDDDTLKFFEKKTEREIEEIKADSVKRMNLRIKEDLEFKKLLLDSELKFRYFRNYKYPPKMHNNHGGVICIGYKVIREDASGIKIAFAVSFCTPKDSFSRVEAKRQILKRYRNNDIVTAHIDFASSKNIDDVLRLIWNSQKIPPYTLGIDPVAQGKEIKLKPWMCYIR